MKRDVPIGTAGIVIAIVFGVGIASAIVGIIVMSVRGRSKAKRAQINAAMVSGSLGKSAADGAGPAPYRIGVGGASDATPLIPPGTPVGGRSGQYPGAHQAYFGNRGAGSESAISPGSTPPVTPLPTIKTEMHSGLRVMGQDDSAHWSADYNARR